jgi:hypothetical protein
LQARVALHQAASQQLVSLVDLEVQGPSRDAFRACYALVQRELEIGSVSEGALRAKVVRECSAAAMPVGKLDAPVALIDRRQRDALTMLGIESLHADPRMRCELAAFGMVDVTTRRLVPYPDAATCSRARERLQAAMAEAAQQAHQAATAWLQGHVTQQRAEVDQACGASPEGPGCREQRRLLELLEDRQQRLAQHRLTAPADVTLHCREQR